MSEVFVPVKLLGWGLIQVQDSFDKQEPQLIVIWGIVEPKLEDILDERLEDLSLRALAEQFWGQDVLELLDPLELLLLQFCPFLLGKLLLVLLVLVSLEEW